MPPLTHCIVLEYIVRTGALTTFGDPHASSTVRIFTAAVIVKASLTNHVVRCDHTVTHAVEAAGHAKVADRIIGPDEVLAVAVRRISIVLTLHDIVARLAL